MYPYRMSIDFHREMNDIEVGMDFESFGMFIGYNDVMIIQQLLETVQKSIEADIEKEEEFRSLQQTEIKESSKLDLNIKFSMFKISLIDERASNKHALLRLNINST